MDFNNSLLPIILGFVASLPGILAFIIQLRKSKVEGDSLITDAAVDVIKTLQEEIKRLNEKNEKLQKRVDDLEDCEKELHQCKLDIEDLFKLVNGG